ncbi:hypothetical protein MLD38_039290 [Melastoma candidum]|uniref:Uncharacterized protein n=2 Tax=Melastoma candidum TaxID=119954 RepID=A0ACB9L2D3_9MYRT|nr:hypothetical protein MLD38_039285 [Melastoma candidum]KAI4303690.1 hypothetical protein MLD38_039290 [Melastoma candidum]
MSSNGGAGVATAEERRATTASGRRRRTRNGIVHLHSRNQFFKIFSLTAIFCFSVVCSNTSLRYIPVSFNQAIGATTCNDLKIVILNY